MGEVSKYGVLARTFRKFGENAAEKTALAVSLLTPVVPSDAQKKIEEKTGVSALNQTFVSGAIEYGIGFFLLPSPLGGGMMADGATKMIVGHIGNSPTASIPVEVTYQTGKYLYKKGRAYFSSLYSEAKHELEKELL